jgi:hypothetical protein
MSDLLEARFEPFQEDSPGDWRDVVRRVRRRSRRRRLTIAAALVLVAALAAPGALALRSTIVDFLQSEPAPRHLVLDFARMDVGAPPGLENHVVYEQTRKIFERTLENGRTQTLWVAPTKTGGFCTALTGPHGNGGFGCLDKPYPVAPTVAVAGPITPAGSIEGGPVLVWGSVGIENADRIELRYEDGAVDAQPLTWVSKPIDAAFFLFDVRRDHWQPGHRFDRLVVRNNEGGALHSEPVAFHGPPAIDPKTQAPAEALQEQARKLIVVHAHTGVDAVLWTAPTKDGRECHWLRYGAGGFGGGCAPSGTPRPRWLSGSRREATSCSSGEGLRGPMLRASRSDMRTAAARSCPSSKECRSTRFHRNTFRAGTGRTC